MKDYILEIMKYVGIPVSITYTVYGVLSNIEFGVKMFIRIAYCFNSTFKDIYYVLMGLVVIATMSKAYTVNEIQNNDKKSANLLQNE